MKPRSFSTAFAILLAISFGAGVVWIGRYSVTLALRSDSPQSAQASSISTASVQNAIAAPSITPIATATEPAVLPAPTAAIAPKRDPNTLTILMAGDIMFDRNVRLLGNENGYDSLLSGVAPLFKSVDIAVANLEGPITASSSKTLLTGNVLTSLLTFTFPPMAASALENAGVSLVSLANNHTDNFGRSGYAETKQWLTQANVAWFGSPWNDYGLDKTMCKNGVCVAFVGYHAFQPGFDRIITDVKRLKATTDDFVIVMPHWGVEYQPHPTSSQKAQARELVAAGADAVIGAHPHVIEDHEWIGGVPVFYSLGNLLFDQYFSDATMKGDIVELNLVKNATGTHLDHLSMYEASTASKKGVTVSAEPVDIMNP